MYESYNGSTDMLASLLFNLALLPFSVVVLLLTIVFVNKLFIWFKLTGSYYTKFLVITLVVALCYTLFSNYLNTILYTPKYDAKAFAFDLFIHNHKNDKYQQRK